MTGNRRDSKPTAKKKKKMKLKSTPNKHKKYTTYTRKQLAVRALVTSLAVRTLVTSQAIRTLVK